MKRSKIAILLGSPQTFDLPAFKYFVLSLNRIQAFYEFCFPVQHEFAFSQPTYTEDDLDKQYAQIPRQLRKQYDYLVIIANGRIDGDLFYICGSEYSFITTDGWDRNFAPPSVFDYIVNSLVGCLIHFQTEMELDSHDDTTYGCVLDYVEIKADNRVGIITGSICDDHKRRILDLTSKQYVDEMENILSRKWLGKIEDFDSIAFNLKKHFRFNINRDSGFKKTGAERMKESLLDLPGEAISKVTLTIIGSLLTALLVYLGLASDK